jgi:hypothetical protein
MAAVLLRSPDMTETDALHTYLNDHLAGSETAVQLLGHLIEAAKEPEERQFFEQLRVEIGDDRETLERLLAEAGGQTSTVRQVGGWLAEKVNRLKLMLDDPARGTLERLESLELLTLGIYGKRALWRALAAAGLPSFAYVDFANLVKRAEDQHDRVEGRRLESARRVLSDGRTRPTPAASAR